MAIPLRKKKEKRKFPVGKPKRTVENDKADKRSVYGMRGSPAELFGAISPSKGTLDGNKIVSWDAIPLCTDHCPIWNVCTYRHKKCTVMKAYVGSAASIILNTYDLNQSDALKVGTHLVPLYRNLCRLQIVEYSLNTITRVNKAGNIALHPVYSEIRSYIVSIENMWKQIGLTPDKLRKRKMQYNGSQHIPESIPSVGDVVNGNPDYYDNLSKEDDDTPSKES